MKDRESARLQAWWEMAGGQWMEGACEGLGDGACDHMENSRNECNHSISEWVKPE